jgi:hypothetical protein
MSRRTERCSTNVISPVDSFEPYPGSVRSPDATSSPTTVMRRKPGRETSVRRASALPLPAVRRRIFEQACELAITGDRRDLVAVLANRFSVSQRIVHLSLIAEGMCHERRAAVLHNGVISLFAEARETQIAIESELSEVA